MTPVQRVRRARMVLAGTVLLAAALWSAAAGMVVVLLIALTSIVGLSAGAALLWPMTIAAALGAVAVVLWRERAVWSIERVALWLEERAPQLKYALVTVVDPRYAVGQAATDQGRAALLQAAGRADVEAIVRRSAGRTIAWAAAAFLITGAIVQLLHATERLGSMSGLRGRGAAAKPLANRLTKLRAEVVPPAYSGLPRHTVSDPTNVSGLYGTKIRFLGDGPPAGVTAIVDRDTTFKDTLTAQAAGSDWAVPLPMPKLPGLIRFQDRAYRRSVVLEPLTDSVPRVLLRLPARDTTWRWDQVPRGELALEADIEDDYGINTAFFEILVSTGGAENFETKDKSTARVSFGGKKQGTLRTTVNYASLGVGQGTVLHIRAVAFDNNNVADSAGKGVSETRTLRISTKSEYDTTSVMPADPLPIDSLWMGQRQLNARTDTLIRFKKSKLSPKEYADTSIGYGDRQALIRGRVEQLILLLEDDGVGGRMETESSRLLRQASEQMWTAQGFLAINFPDSAYVPPKSSMKEALRLLEEARKARKYYLRGVLQVRPVNIDEARLKGVDSSANAADRTERKIPDDLRHALRSRLAAVVPFAVASPREAIDSLMLVRAEALRGAPAIAAALQEAIDAAHQGKATVGPLTRAQRLLDPPPRVMTGPVEWGGGVLP